MVGLWSLRQSSAVYVLRSRSKLLDRDSFPTLSWRQEVIFARAGYYWRCFGWEKRLRVQSIREKWQVWINRHNLDADQHQKQSKAEDIQIWLWFNRVLMCKDRVKHGLEPRPDFARSTTQRWLIWGWCYGKGNHETIRRSGKPQRENRT